jgi:hypothetical protein
MVRVSSVDELNQVLADFRGRVQDKEKEESPPPGSTDEMSLLTSRCS